MQSLTSSRSEAPLRAPLTANTEQTQPENKAYYPALDGFRCFAFLAVLVEHYALTPWGWAGLDFFFVLSGFLITGILWDTRNAPNRFSTFYVRRTLRIFPLYYGVMIALLCCGPVLHWRLSTLWIVWPLYVGNYVWLVPHFRASQSLTQVAFFQPHGVLRGHPVVLNLGHFWSLCVEEQFYLFWPAVVFFCRRRTLIWVCAGSVPVCLLLRILGSLTLPSWYLGQDVLARTTPLRLDGLLLGGLAALLLGGSMREPLLRWSRFALSAAICIVGVWMIAVPEGHIWKSPYTYPSWYATWGHTFTALIGVLVILVAIQKGTWVYRLLNISAFRWLGRLTYGAYVFHDIPHRLCAHVAHKIYPPWEGYIAAALALVCSMTLAWLSFRFFEAPFLNLKRRWSAAALGERSRRTAARAALS